VSLLHALSAVVFLECRQNRQRWLTIQC